MKVEKLQYENFLKSSIENLSAFKKRVMAEFDRFL